MYISYVKKSYLFLLLISASAAAYNLQPYPDKAALMLVTAHADDEGIFFGGAIPYYSLEKHLPVIVVCMSHDSGDSRADELRCAVWTYGCRYEPVFGGFGDCCFEQDMVCNWQCWGGKDTAVAFVCAQIRRFKPDVVLCHDFGGEYGHPNHIGAAIAATEACLASKDSTKFAGQLTELDVWDVKKCYVHMLDSNQMTHSWDIECGSLDGRTLREIVSEGLGCHASQGAHTKCINGCNGEYAAWPAENWGLFYTSVGKDSIAKDNFFENVDISGYAAKNYAKKRFLIYSRANAFQDSYNLQGQKVSSLAGDRTARAARFTLPSGTYIYTGSVDKRRVSGAAIKF